MSNEQIDLRALLENERFPLSNKYDPQWVLDNQMGPNALWLTEWLCRDMDLKPGMRVLDMGCGRCLSSVFLAREFGVQVWANDLWISANDNWQRIGEAGLEDQIFPIHAEAHALPYAHDFFDAIVSVDSYHYFGTDDLYLDYFQKYVKPGGQIGIVVPGLVQDFDGPVPDHLKAWWEPSYSSFRTPQWWRRHLGQTELLDDLEVSIIPDGWRDWLQLDNAKSGGDTTNPNDSEAAALQADQGRYLGIVQITARREENK